MCFSQRWRERSLEEELKDVERDQPVASADEEAERQTEVAETAEERELVEV